MQVGAYGPQLKSQKNSTSQRSRTSTQNKIYNARYKDKKKDWYLQRRYGITYAERDAMLSAQGGVCAICAADNPQKGGQDWAVDHCHSTGNVRGILCHPCNVALGLMRDNVTTLSNAIDYLKKH